MNKISLKLYVLIIFLFISFFLGLIEWVAWLSGETIPHEKLAKQQKINNHLLILTQQPFYTLKLARYAEEKPDVVYIGTSRSMHVRSAMLKPYRFYNACLTAWTFDQLTEYLQLMLSVHTPKVIIFSLDYFMFTPGFVVEHKPQNDFHIDRSYKDHLKSLGSFLGFFVKSPEETFNKLKLTENHKNLMGMPAIMQESGIRYDGSFSFSKQKLNDFATKNITAKCLIEAMSGAPAIDPSQMEALKKFAHLATKNNITLVAIALPIFKDGLDYLDNEKSYWGYSGVWRDFNKPETREFFKEQGIHFFDAQRVAYKDKTTFMDTYHPSERGVLATLNFLEKDPEFRKIFDKLDYVALEKEYQHAIDHNSVFDIYKDKF